jgi:hypothetical protein
LESQRAREEEAKAIDMQIGDSGSERAAVPYGGGGGMMGRTEGEEE